MYPQDLNILLRSNNNDDIDYQYSCLISDPGEHVTVLSSQGLAWPSCVLHILRSRWRTSLPVCELWRLYWASLGPEPRLGMTRSVWRFFCRPGCECTRSDCLSVSGPECGAAQRPPQAHGDQGVAECPAGCVEFAAAGCLCCPGARQRETPQCRR